MIESIESKIIDIMKQIDSPSASIPGIGLISATTIISEFGNFARFNSSTQWIAYAGIDVGISQFKTKSFKGKKSLRVADRHVAKNSHNLLPRDSSN